MTFEDIFAGRIALTRCARHICQAGLVGFDHSIPVFRNLDFEQAFRIVERLLIELGEEFTHQKKQFDHRKKLRARSQKLGART